MSSYLTAISWRQSYSFVRYVNRSLISIGKIIILFLIYPLAEAVGQIDDNAQTVTLKLSCSAENNCFSEISSLNDWLAIIRQPNEQSPLLIEVGAGEFSGTFKCTNLSHITIRGSGRTNSTISGNKNFIPGGLIFAPGIVLNNCSSLNISNLKIKGEYGAVWWEGSGETSWTDIDLEGAGRGWYSKAPCDESTTKHSWFNSRLISTPYLSSNVTYTAACGETWLYNSELSAKSHSPDSIDWSWGVMQALWAIGGKTRVLGGALRTEVTIPPQASIASIGNELLEIVRVDHDAIVHISATAIEFDSTVDTPLYALVTTGNGKLHASNSSYELHHPNSIAHRLDQRGGEIIAPHHWGASTVPPTIVSITGKDQFIETDCAAEGCQNPGNETHLMIYNTSCATDGPWFDSTTMRCRGL